MEFEWHEAKRLRNLEKHGLDFLDASLVFEEGHLIELAKSAGSEQRELAIGRIDGHYVALIFTRRGDVIRIISLRKARHGERRGYQALFG